MIDKINYVTYQTFPANTANSLQTISNIKYLARSGVKLNLIFPLREKQSTSNLSKIQEFYNFTEDIKIVGTKHPLPFGKIKIFKRVSFLVSHFIWSYMTVKKLLKSGTAKNEYFFTRSDWVFYFLSKKQCKVVYECHQFTKIRKFLIYKSLLNRESKIIFLNKLLENDYKSSYALNKNYEVLQNGVDLNLFENTDFRNTNDVIFVGRLTRFNDSRNIDFLIKGFSELDSKFTLKIIGASPKEVLIYSNLVKSEGLEERVQIFENMPHQQVASFLKNSGIGILINSMSNEHSTKYTSPLKYFEYLASGLNVVAVDFRSHRALPFSEKITFFENNNLESFRNAILKSSKKFLPAKDLRQISLEARVSKILSLLQK